MTNITYFRPCPTHLEWLPVIPNIAAANLRRKAAIDVLIEKIELYQD